MATLGYKSQLNKIKTKEQEKYSFRRDGVKISVEINSNPLLGSVRFLEIEALPQSLDKSPGIEFVYQIARELGMQNPELNTLQGGNREDRGYQKLQNLGRGYKGSVGYYKYIPIVR